MYEWDKFTTVFKEKPDYSLDHKQVESITRHRKELGGLLFFDHVWSSLGLKQSSKLYPPKTNHELKTVWQKIAQSTAPDFQRHALLYYILKDCRQLNEADATFAERVYLPRKYELLMRGLWEMDHGQFTRALDYLTDTSLTPTFADEVLQALLIHPKSDPRLAMAYHTAVSPPMRNVQVRDAYFAMLCETNIVEAYQFCQNAPESIREQLYSKLVMTVHSSIPSDLRPERALTLLGLPMSAEEEMWFESCLLHGEGSKCAGAKDSVLTRRISMNSRVEGLDILDQVRGQRINGVNWDDIRSSAKEAAMT